MAQTTTRTNNSELASALRLSLLRAARRLRLQRVHTELTLSQLSALSSVRKHGPMSAGEVASIERVQPPSMTKILSSLEGGGWIARTAHAEDRRQSVISITEEGIRLLDEDTRARDEWLASQLQRFSTEECDVLSKAIDVLDRLGSG